jgi:hypothetical protein
LFPLFSYSQARRVEHDIDIVRHWKPGINKLATNGNTETPFKQSPVVIYANDPGLMNVSNLRGSSGACVL